MFPNHSLYFFEDLAFKLYLLDKISMLTFKWQQTSLNYYHRLYHIGIFQEFVRDHVDTRLDKNLIILIHLKRKKN